jgi:hypothetical protein
MVALDDQAFSKRSEYSLRRVIAVFHDATDGNRYFVGVEGMPRMSGSSQSSR